MAEEELKKIRNSKLSIQLKGIIAVSEHPLEDVACILKVSTRSILRWIKWFKEGGIESLKDQPKGHMKSKLQEEHKQEIESWIISGKNSAGKPTHWTIDKLKKEIEKKFDINIGRTPLWKHLKKLDLKLKKPRPTHAKADKEAQEAFKKTQDREY
jgi:transposase